MAKPEGSGPYWAAFWSGIVLIGITTGLLVATVELRAHWHDPFFIAAAIATGVGVLALLYLALRATIRARAAHRLTTLIWDAERLERGFFALQDYPIERQDWAAFVALAQESRKWGIRTGRFVRRHYDQHHLRRYRDPQGRPTPPSLRPLEGAREGFIEELRERRRRLEEFRGEYIT
jgi:hypothetical protein